MQYQTTQSDYILPQVSLQLRRGMNTQALSYPCHKQGKKWYNLFSHSYYPIIKMKRVYGFFPLSLEKKLYVKNGKQWQDSHIRKFLSHQIYWNQTSQTHNVLSPQHLSIITPKKIETWKRKSNHCTESEKVIPSKGQLGKTVQLQNLRFHKQNEKQYEKGQKLNTSNNTSRDKTITNPKKKKKRSKIYPNYSVYAEERKEEPDGVRLDFLRGGCLARAIDSELKAVVWEGFRENENGAQCFNFGQKLVISKTVNSPKQNFGTSRYFIS